MATLPAISAAKNGRVGSTCTGLLGTLNRSVSEGFKSFPRLHFGLVWDVSFLTARSLNTFGRLGQDGSKRCRSNGNVHGPPQSKTGNA